MKNFDFSGLSSILLVTSAMLFFFMGCSKDNPEIEIPVEIDYTELTEKAIEEFLDFAQVPRPAYHLDAPRAYLKDYAQKHGWEWQRDEYGNCWFDVPATNGMESAPKIILQGHMDMVCAVAEGESLDVLKDVGTPVRDDDRLYGRHMNLGIDDGIGIGSILALVTSEISHGPLRCLFTADEEVGLFGVRDLSAQTLDAGYLVCLDGEVEANMYMGSAGSYHFNVSKELETAGETGGLVKMIVRIGGLKGGHSGNDINKHRLSGFTVIRNLMKDALSAYDVNLISIDGGSVENAIITSAEIVFAIKESDSDKVISEIEQVLTTLAKEFPEETIKKEIKREAVSSGDCLYAPAANSPLVKMMDALIQGVVEEIPEGHVTKSNNIGVVQLVQGKIIMRAMIRSDYQDWLDSEMERVGNKAQEFGFTHSITNNIPSWRNTDNDLQKMIEKKYGELLGVKINRYYTQGGVEPAWFCLTNPNMGIVCYGPKIENAHTINETLHIHTLTPVLQSLGYALQHAGELR